MTPTDAGVTDDAMYGIVHVVTARLSLRLLLECTNLPQTTYSSFLFVVGELLSHSGNSHPMRSSPMRPGFRSYPQPVHPMHPDRRGMYYRFYDRYRIFNDWRTRPFPFRFYCESIVFRRDIRYNRAEEICSYIRVISILFISIRILEKSGIYC